MAWSFARWGAASTAAVLVLAGAARAEPAIGAGFVADYRAMLKRGDFASAAGALVKAWPGPRGQAHAQALGIALAPRLDRRGTAPDGAEAPALAVLDAIAASGAADQAMICAALLREIAIGHADTVEKRWGKRNKSRALTDPLAERAAALLDAADPIVRAAAEWAIAIRVANDNEKTYLTWNAPREYRTWPAEDPPQWFARWHAIDASDHLALDYARQAIDRDAFRTRAALRGSAEDIARRARRPARDAKTPGAEAARAALDAAVGAMQDDTAGLCELRRRWLDVRRAARRLIFLGPAVDFDCLVYATRHSGRKHLVPMSSRASDHPPGGDVYVQRGLAPNSPRRALIDGRLKWGHVQDMDLYWDADRLVVAYSEQPLWARSGSSGVIDGIVYDCGSEPTHLWEISLPDGELRQLTDSNVYADMEPCYLPEGDVIFASDRSRGSTHCGTWKLNGYFSPPNLYRLDRDTLEVRRISYNKDEDRYPHVANDGTVVYMRWDYQERSFSRTQPLWVINPDGTMNDGLYKTHTPGSPCTLREPRPIIGSMKLVALACGHHEHIEGAICIIDPDGGRNRIEQMRYVTPRCSPTEFGYGEAGCVPEGGVPDRYGLYHTPFALSEQCFLASYAYGAPASTSFAAYYLDVWGNKELLRRDPIYDVAVPLPLKPRTRPPVLAERPEPGIGYALAYVHDVHSDLPGVERGRVRYIRLLERLQWFEPEKLGGTGVQWKPGTNYASMFSYWAPGATRVIGTVPVARDGSAYFKVPVGMAVYFQALDERKLLVRHMRTHVEFQPGETRGCIGCHETQPRAVPLRSDRVALALASPPSKPVPPPWGDRQIMGFERHIQPVLQKRCVSCHSGRKPKGGLDLGAKEDRYGYMQSYRSLMGVKPGEPTPMGCKGITPDGVKIDYDEQRSRRYYAARRNGDFFMPEAALLRLSNWNIDTEITMPLAFGSPRSPLIRKLLDDPEHRKIALTDAEWETLVTWVDVNAPYHDTHVRQRRPRKRDRPTERVDVKLDDPWSEGEKGFEIVPLEAGRAGTRARYGPRARAR